MSSLRLHLATAFLIGALAVVSGSGCRASQQAQLNVLSVEKSANAAGDRVVYVEVVNRAQRPMRLQRLQYTFAGSGNRSQLVELELGRRLVEAGAAVVVEVPLTMADAALGTTLTLAGKLWAEQDEIVRSFAVAAEIATDDDQL